MARTFTDRELQPKDAAEYLKSTPGVQLVDVRQPDEHKEARLAKAKLIPLGTLDVRLNELDKAKPVLFYCAAGGRSGQALRFAEQAGFSQAKHIAGGIGAWAAAGLPYES
ncbi:MAG: rhodanese-like domain-containing protein [Desulfobaccales bacterium]